MSKQFNPILKKYHSGGLSQHDQCLDFCASKPAWGMFSNDDQYLVDGKMVPTKRYYAAQLEHFIQTEYKAIQKKTHYEIIREGTPAKLFFDVDYKFGDGGMSTKELNGLIDLLTTTTIQVCADLFKCKPAMLQMDASTDIKFSRHIVCTNVVLPCIQDCGLVVSAVLQREHSLTAIVDTKVYTRNRAFRLLYSSKLGKNNPLVLLGGDSTFKAEDLMNSFVSCFFGDPPHIHTPPDEFTQRVNKRRATVNVRGPNKRQQISAALWPEML